MCHQTNPQPALTLSEIAVYAVMIITLLLMFGFVGNDDFKEEQARQERLAQYDEQRELEWQEARREFIHNLPFDHTYESCFQIAPKRFEEWQKDEACTDFVQIKKEILAEANAPTEKLTSSPNKESRNEQASVHIKSH